MLSLLFLFTLISSFQSLFCRLYTSARNGQGAIPFSVFYSAFAGLCTLALNRFSYHPAPATLLLGLANAAVLLTYNIAMVRCGSLGSYAFMMLSMLSGGILVPMFYDMLYLKYAFNALQIAAIFLMIAAFIVMNLDGLRGKKNTRYLLWCLILFLTNGLYAVLMNLQQTLMQFTQRREMIVTTFLGTAVLAAAFLLLSKRGQFIAEFRMGKRAALMMVISSISATIAVNLLMHIIQSINVTVLSAVSNGGVLVFSSIYAFTIFKEKPEARTVVGILMACASIVMLSL